MSPQPLQYLQNMFFLTDRGWNSWTNSLVGPHSWHGMFRPLDHSHGDSNWTSCKLTTTNRKSVKSPPSLLNLNSLPALPVFLLSLPTHLPTLLFTPFCSLSRRSQSCSSASACKPYVLGLRVHVRHGLSAARHVSSLDPSQLPITITYSHPPRQYALAVNYP